MSERRPAIGGAEHADELGLVHDFRRPHAIVASATRAAHRQQVRRRSAPRRLVDIDDLAEAVEFWLSDRAKSITGTVLTVNAGSPA